MKIQRTESNQNNLKKKKKNRGFLLPGFKI